MNLFLVLLLVVIGYFSLFIWILSRASGRYSLSFLMIISLLIYCPLIGFCSVLGNYLGEVGILLYAICIIYCVFYLAFQIRYIAAFHPKIRKMILAALLVYILAVSYITLFMRAEGSDDRVQMILFGWLSGTKEHALEHTIQNVAMFLPLGFLAFFIIMGCETKKAFLLSISVGLTYSILIETVQLLFSIGTCDIDDILANTLGAFLGALVAFISQKLIENEKHNLI